MKRLTSISILILFFAALPLKTCAVELLIPVGQIVGLQLKAKSVTVSAFDDVLGKNARNAGLRIGDEILQINGNPVSVPEDIRNALSGSTDPVTLTVRRGGKQCRVTVSPQQQAGQRKLGVYLRQGISGIGTVTWYNPKSRTFAALGHGVNTSKGSPLQMTEGQIYPAEILSVKMGKSGDPGQLKGCSSPESPCGTLLQNTPQGVFGTAVTPWQGEPIPAAEAPELTLGPAVILSTVSSAGPQEYSAEIVKIYPADRTDGRNLLLKITDDALLSTTGGIVQGMSGSPIIQNGRLVGAVTHVLVNDPTMGYGIFIGNMLDAAA